MNRPAAPSLSPELLNAWRVTPERDPEFRTQVWRRIAARQGESGWPAYLRTHALPAASLLAVALVAGAWAGHEQARDQAEARRDAMITAYVQSLDARAMVEQQ
jgi:hypothetical protein